MPQAHPGDLAAVPSSHISGLQPPASPVPEDLMTWHTHDTYIYMQALMHTHELKVSNLKNNNSNNRNQKSSGHLKTAFKRGKILDLKLRTYFSPLPPATHSTHSRPLLLALSAAPCTSLANGSHSSNGAFCDFGSHLL